MRWGGKGDEMVGCKKEGQERERESQWDEEQHTHIPTNTATSTKPVNPSSAPLRRRDAAW